MRKREQPLLDLAGHVAGIAQGLAAILEHLGLPCDVLRHLLHRAGSAAGSACSCPQLLVVLADFGRKLLLARAKPVEARR